MLLLHYKVEIMKTISIVFVCLLAGLLLLSSIAAARITPVNTDMYSSNYVMSSQGESSYPIHLVEHNLPKGMLWYAYIGAQNESYFQNPPLTSTSTTITFWEPSGQYSFSVGANGPYLAKEFNIYATVMNSSVTVNIYFIEQFNVSITEIGVPQGYDWEFTLTDVNNSSNNWGTSGPPFRITQSMYEASGTYRLQVGSNPVPAVSVLGDVGDIIVDNGSVNKTVRFYEVNITQEGLPVNFTNWGFHYLYSGANSNGTTFDRSGFYPGTAGPITLYLPNSTYSVNPVAKDFYSTPLNFSMNGKSLNLTETFYRTYCVTFIEHGLNNSIGEYWEAGGFPMAYGMSSPYIAGAKAEAFLVPNGTFSFNITNIPTQIFMNGNLYNVSVALENANNTFTVNGNNTTVDLYFNATMSLVKQYKPNEPSTVLPSLYDRIAIVAIVVAGVITSAYFYRKRLREKQ